MLGIANRSLRVLRKFQLFWAAVELKDKVVRADRSPCRVQNSCTFALVQRIAFRYFRSGNNNLAAFLERKHKDSIISQQNRGHNAPRTCGAANVVSAAAQDQCCPVPARYTLPALSPMAVTALRNYDRRLAARSRPCQEPHFQVPKPAGLLPECGVQVRVAVPVPSQCLRHCCKAATPTEEASEWTFHPSQAKQHTLSLTEQQRTCPAAPPPFTGEQTCAPAAKHTGIYPIRWPDQSGVS